jgi:cation/acetate symporter
VLQKVTEREKVLTNDPKEIEVRNIFKARADAANANLKDPAAAYTRDKGDLEKKLADLKARGAAPAEMASTEAALAAYPKDENAAKAQWNKDKGPRCPRGATATARHAVPRQGRGGAEHRAQQLPRHRLLHDVRDRSAAAHPDALLHDAQRATGAPVGVLVAVLHFPAVFHRAVARGAGEI